MGNKNEKEQQQDSSKSVLQINGTKNSIQKALKSAKSNAFLYISLESQKSLQKTLKVSIFDGQNPSQTTPESLELVEIIQRIASLGNHLHRVIVSSPETVRIAPLQDILLSLLDNNKNITDLAICLESSPFAYEDFLEITKSIRNFKTITNLTLKMVNKFTDQNALFFPTYTQTVLSFQNLQTLDVLFSFRKLGIYRQEFQEFLKNLQSQKNLWKISLAIEGACYSDICLESLIMLAPLPNLEDLFITTYEFLKKDERDEITSSNIFGSINESLLQKLSQSLLRRIVLKQLNTFDSSTIFGILLRLPNLKTIELGFNSKISNLFDEPRQLLPSNVSPLPSQMPIIDSLTIEILNKPKDIFFKDILSQMSAFKSYNLSFQFWQPTVHLHKQLGVTDFEMEKALLAVVYNKLDIQIDLKQQKMFPCIQNYTSHKDTAILQMLVFEKTIAPIMMCNPQYVKYDLYF